MAMEVRYGHAPHDVKKYDTQELRDNFLVQNLFPENDSRFVYSHVDRIIIGGAKPTTGKVSFGGGEDIGTEHLLSHREMGVINIGGPGTVTVDGIAHKLDNCDALYIGRGSKLIEMTSADAGKPARFYMNSTPARENFPTRVITKAEAKPITMGAEERANKRTLNMYIHPEVAPSALLLMGITKPAPGSVWNTMPCHLHERRMEAYLYFDLDADNRVFHMMGRPEETRHIVVADGEVVISPSWSIHMGVGTGPYTFIWGMTGENQEYNDVSPLPLSALR
ncbi:5-dehydro-4-deoxy-D-glucuronate isomerase [Lacibacterium aquatile]|uniref:4-deoxy-L-threo-5-hexosulose-uronate ketol-isomerase n=1 Tax=Lacibacterium aquatile TaxID=1168082 RepID=A0ABW5DN27_9PROT